MASNIKTVSRIGFWSALLTAVFAAGSFAIAIATPPRSGPFCLTGCITYPYANVALFFPRDYFWMVPGIFLTPLFVVLMACIHRSADEDKKVFSLIGLSFALVSAALITMDYFVQLTVMQPSLLQGEVNGLALFSQYNPHGIFIALEDLGYLMMSLAFLFCRLGFHSSRTAYPIHSLGLPYQFSGVFRVVHRPHSPLWEWSRIQVRSDRHHHKLDHADRLGHFAQHNVQACRTARE